MFLFIYKVLISWLKLLICGSMWKLFYHDIASLDYCRPSLLYIWKLQNSYNVQASIKVSI